MATPIPESAIFHLAEDTVQQAFIAAWSGLSGLKQPERFGGWLRGIVRFESSRILRSHHRVQTPLTEADTSSIGSQEPPHIIERREGFNRVLAAVNRLPLAEREVAILYYVNDHSQREVAAFLNLPVTTVNNRLRTARRRLKEGQLLTMVNDALNEHQLPDTFAARIGEIVLTKGVVVDARFSSGQRPRVLSALTVTDDTSGPAVTVEAIQHLDDHLVRCIALTTEAFQLSAGMQITDTGGPISIPLDRAAINEVISTVRPSSQPVIAESGIKAIDLLSPLPQRGRVALVGDMQTGKMVLVEELIQRLTDTTNELSILIFVETPDEVAIINDLEYRTSANVQAIYLPVSDATPEALGDITSGMDAVVSLTRHLAERGHYPAIDPMRSTSRLLDAGIASSEHIEASNEVRALLAGDNDDARSQRVRHFLTQPFFVAEEYTKRPGRHVSLAETIHGCRTLLDGEHNDLSHDALCMIGPLDDVLDNS